MVCQYATRHIKTEATCILACDFYFFFIVFIRKMAPKIIFIPGDDSLYPHVPKINSTSIFLIKNIDSSATKQASILFLEFSLFAPADMVLCCADTGPL